MAAKPSLTRELLDGMLAKMEEQRCQWEHAATALRVPAGTVKSWRLQGESEDCPAWLRDGLVELREAEARIAYAEADRVDKLVKDGRTTSSTGYHMLKARFPRYFDRPAQKSEVEVSGQVQLVVRRQVVGMEPEKPAKGES